MTSTTTVPLEKSIKKVLLVMSGKGGVGKSTVAVNLAFALRDQGLSVGLLDVDLTGPSVPRLVGALGKPVHKASSGWVPVYINDDSAVEGIGGGSGGASNGDAASAPPPPPPLAVMSIAFLLPHEDDAIVWRGPKKTAVIKQFLADVLWGALDVLVIDTPPGTSDEHLTTIECLLSDAATRHTAAVLVTTPQMASIDDVRKELAFCRAVNLPVLGVFENMSGFVCPPPTHSPLAPVTERSVCNADEHRPSCTMPRHARHSSSATSDPLTF